MAFSRQALDEDIVCIAIQQLDIGTRLVLILIFLVLFLLLNILNMVVIVHLEFFYIVIEPLVRRMLECIIPETSFKIFMSLSMDARSQHVQ